MQYGNIRKGVFISRPNRFTAEICIEGNTEICHVKNTGRCRELLVPGAEVYVTKAENPARKTLYDLVCVRKGEVLFNIDSQAPNQVFGEWARESGFFGEITYIKPECTFGDSRFDFYMETAKKKIFVEVKGVTLEEEGVVRFPDAPTKRGVKHLQHLEKCIDAGYEAHVFFIAKTESAERFMPNREAHPAFADALLHASQNGVGVHCLSCVVTPDSLRIRDFIPIKL